MRIPTVAVGVVAVLGPAAAAFSQCEPQTLEPLGMPEGGSFGSRMLMDDRFLFIGNPGEPTLCPDPFDCGTGALHVFELDGDGLWQRTQHIVPPDITVGSGFGGSFSRDGDRLLVGAGGAIVNGEPAGKSYLYEHDGEQWREVFQFRPSEPTFRQGFGGVVALQDDAAVLLNYRPLKLVLFEEAAGDWVLVEEIDAPLPATTGFGLPIIMRDDWVFVGANADDSEVEWGGSVYVYQRVPGEGLRFIQRLISPDVASAPDFGPRFGASIDYHKGTLAISGPFASRTHEGQGVIYVYRLINDSWRLTQEVVHASPQEYHNLGVDIDLHGDILAAGTLDEDPRTINGAAYVFRPRPDGLWQQERRIEPDGRQGEFAHQVATDGDRLAIGAPGAVFGGFSVGLVHAYDLACFDCAPDLDLDGALTIYDFLSFLNLFEDGEAAADFDGDGELTVFDFLAFQDAFQAGC